MRDAGIGLVNLANNHTFDAEERGFQDTLRALSLAGIAHVGGGTDLADSPKPVILERHCIKLWVLCFPQFNKIRQTPLTAAGTARCVPIGPFSFKSAIP